MNNATKEVSFDTFIKNTVTTLPFQCFFFSKLNVGKKVADNFTTHRCNEL